MLCVSVGNVWAAHRLRLAPVGWPVSGQGQLPRPAAQRGQWTCPLGGLDETAQVGPQEETQRVGGAWHVSKCHWVELTPGNHLNVKLVLPLTLPTNCSLTWQFWQHLHTFHYSWLATTWPKPIARHDGVYSNHPDRGCWKRLHKQSAIFTILPQSELDRLDTRTK